MKSRVYSKKAFTLVEMLTVLVIIGIIGGILYSVFFLNWQLFSQYISRADMGQEVDSIFETIAHDGRFSSNITFSSTATTKEADMTTPNGTVAYIMNNNGTLTVTRGGNVTVLSNKLNFGISSFSIKDKALTVVLMLQDNILGRPLNFGSGLTITPRN